MDNSKTDFFNINNTTNENEELIHSIYNSILKIRYTSIYENNEKLGAFLKLIIELQHKEEPQDVVLKGKELTCYIGESLKSLDTWTQILGFKSKTHTSRFFDELQDNGLITKTNEKVTTRISITNHSKMKREMKQLNNCKSTHYNNNCNGKCNGNPHNVTENVTEFETIIKDFANSLTETKTSNYENIYNKKNSYNETENVTENDTRQLYNNKEKKEIIKERKEKFKLLKCTNYKDDDNFQINSIEDFKKLENYEKFPEYFEKHSEDISENNIDMVFEKAKNKGFENYKYKFKNYTNYLKWYFFKMLNIKGHGFVYFRNDYEKTFIIVNLFEFYEEEIKKNLKGINFDQFHKVCEEFKNKILPRQNKQKFNYKYIKTSLVNNSKNYLEKGYK